MAILKPSTIYKSYDFDEFVAILAKKVIMFFCKNRYQIVKNCTICNLNGFKIDRISVFLVFSVLVEYCTAKKYFIASSLTKSLHL